MKTSVYYLTPYGGPRSITRCILVTSVYYLTPYGGPQSITKPLINSYYSFNLT